VNIVITKSKEDVWSAITDFERCGDFISSIINLEVLNRPETGLVGLKWKETRLMFGKEATETMWITDAVENQYYFTRAESHGAVYISRLILTEDRGRTTLTMSFLSAPQSMAAKVFAPLMGVLLKKSMERELLKDLVDIKRYVEAAENTSK
jgi:hypothetical protein